MRFASFLPLLGLSGAVLLSLFERDARACGGCFAPPSERTVVTDHRMALSVSPVQTVLWDQITYSGSPSEFAWVLPVRPGAKLELSHNEWFAALDASTQPIIYGPSPASGAGCALAGCGAASSATGSPGGGVQVINDSVVGPYETVTLRSTNPQALTQWLTGHGYAIPTTIQPTIDEYVKEQFDFIALRLLPSCNERSMQPVRVVTPGADPTLPLRMVAAGVGAHVGITLFVISEGRYHPQNFPDATIDYSRLRWDRYQNRSNYQDLATTAMAQGGGLSWITEYAGQPQTNGYGNYNPNYGTGYYGGGNPGLFDVYDGLCKYPASGSGTSSGGDLPGDPCPRTDAGAPASDAGNADAATDDAGPVPGDAGAIDAGGDAGDDAASAEDAGASDAGGDAGDAGPYTPPADACASFDDLDVALVGLHSGNVWLTRLRADLPAAALDTDLRLEPTVSQVPESNVHYASKYADAPPDKLGQGCSSAPTGRRFYGALGLMGLTALGVGRILRRRRRG